MKNNPNEIDDEFVGRKRSFTRQEWAGSLGAFMVIAFINGAFTLGFAFSWMAIYLVELFTPTVRATAASFVFNGARLIAWMFPIIAGQIVASTGGVARAALIMSSAYAIGLIVPFFVPETAGRACVTGVSLGRRAQSGAGSMTLSELVGENERSVRQEKDPAK